MKSRWKSTETQFKLEDQAMKLQGDKLTRQMSVELKSDNVERVCHDCRRCEEPEVQDT